MSSRGAPLERRARGNCPRCSPLNPALIAAVISTIPAVDCSWHPKGDTKAKYMMNLNQILFFRENKRQHQPALTLQSTLSHKNVSFSIRNCKVIVRPLIFSTASATPLAIMYSSSPKSPCKARKSVNRTKTSLRQCLVASMSQTDLLQP